MQSLRKQKQHILNLREMSLCNKTNKFQPPHDQEGDQTTRAPNSTGALAGEDAAGGEVVGEAHRRGGLNGSGGAVMDGETLLVAVGEVFPLGLPSIPRARRTGNPASFRFCGIPLGPARWSTDSAASGSRSSVPSAQTQQEEAPKVVVHASPAGGWTNDQETGALGTLARYLPIRGCAFESKLFANSANFDAARFSLINNSCCLPSAQFRYI